MELLVSTDILEAQDVQRDFKCKVLFFFHKMLRCLSICTTCLLSMLQAITIGPSSSWWAKFKPKSPSPILCSFLFSWVLNMSIGGNLLLYTVAIPNETPATLMFLTEHCSILPMSYTHKALFFTLMAFRDVSFMGPMALSSAYILILLYRHKQWSQHFHSKHLSPRSSPGQKATQTILLRCFVIMYCVGLIISFSMAMTWMNDPILVCIQMTVANGYGTVSPLVLISAEKQIIKIIQTIWGRKASI
ncbi:vomeronasal type-1 receptor 90-like [Dasypus novemcinctus]|uniref:vomeronasal type-1 receptor 90-like n=1 Tax=Dasypus novemcinctus TaxID=9361 RepID=UPI00265E743B|nr:vomeronasal type-1 receptor 90-like [Dasypus novemcinctus]